MTTALHLRPLDEEADITHLATLMNATASEQAGISAVTEQTLRESELKRQPGDIVGALTAWDSEERLCGYGRAGRRAYHAPGEFNVNILVAPAFRNQGLGGQLFADLQTWAVTQQAARLTAGVRADCAECVAFAHKREFAIVRHTFSSTLDVAAFDASRFAGTVERLEASGLRFFSFADTDGSEAARRKLYDLNIATGQDVPGSRPDSIRPFEAFSEDVFNGYWFRPDGQLFAADGDAWVGMCAVGEVSPGVMSNMMTGVLPGWRGRGIAFALKLQAIAFCQRHGAAILQTGNDSTNQAMLTINRKLGYRPDPGVYHLEKRLP